MEQHTLGEETNMGTLCSILDEDNLQHSLDSYFRRPPLSCIGNLNNLLLKPYDISRLVVVAAALKACTVFS
jgi:hypothetical protein